MASAAVELNIDEFKELATHVINTNKENQKKGIFPSTLEVEGESGIGKTSSIKQLAEEIKYDFKKVNLAQLDELGDIIGFPTRQFEMAIDTTAGDKATLQGDAAKNYKPSWQTRWADEALLDDFRKKGYQVTGKDKMAYSLPEWVPTHDDGCIVLFDDYNRAQQRFLQALMEILDRQEYISWKMPKNVTIILSANPDNGDYQVQSQDSAQKTRYASVKLKFDVECWAKWAETQGIDGRCINFMLMHPELIKGDINARAVTTFFNLISSVKDFIKELPLISMLADGTVGPEFGGMFIAFINNKLDKLMDPKKMLLGKDEEAVIRELKGTIGINNNYRADIASVLCTRFTNYTMTYANEGNPITDPVIDRIKKMATSDAFGNDLNYFTIREILNGDKKKFRKIMMDPEVVKMATK